MPRGTASRAAWGRAPAERRPFRRAAARHRGGVRKPSASAPRPAEHRGKPSDGLAWAWQSVSRARPLSRRSAPSIGDWCLGVCAMPPCAPREPCALRGLGAWTVRAVRPRRGGLGLHRTGCEHIARAYARRAHSWVSGTALRTACAPTRARARGAASAARLAGRRVRCRGSNRGLGRGRSRGWWRVGGF